MTILKTTLYLLAILFAHGVAGRMDYDDAVMLDDARRTTVVAECPADGTQETQESAATSMEPQLDPTDTGAEMRSASDGVTCASQAL